MSLREDKKVKRKENVINGQKIIRSKQMHEKFRYLLTLSMSIVVNDCTVPQCGRTP